MALKVKNFELPDGLILEEAYLRIQSISTANIDYEFFEMISETEEKLSWTTRMETTATVFIWPDEIARQNRAIAVHWFTFQLDYNLSTLDNIYEQAYMKLNEIYPEGEGC